jgi:hypothetical protein
METNPGLTILHSSTVPIPTDVLGSHPSAGHFKQLKAPNGIKNMLMLQEWNKCVLKVTGAHRQLLTNTKQLFLANGREIRLR